jgi:hypothetical protein
LKHGIKVGSIVLDPSNGRAGAVLADLKPRDYRVNWRIWRDDKR